MATIKVTGKVQKHLGDKGFVLAEPIRKQTDGVWETIGNRYFSVWFRELPAVNAEVEVVGSFSAKLEEYQGKTQLKQTINASSVAPYTTKVMGQAFSAESAKESARIAQEVVKSADDELPF